MFENVISEINLYFFHLLKKPQGWEAKLASNVCFSNSSDAKVAERMQT